ncbi:MAG: helix-turn-helix domain-containing protein [Clostridia bacterium]|nr:helix-turn-helix domain-containing protein [Clostridia bacterium]
MKTLRHEAELSQAELAEIMGVSVQSVSKWECDNNMPDVSLILPLASILKVTTDCLLGAGTNEEEDKKKLHDELEEYYKMPFKPGHENHNYLAYLAEKEFLKKYPLNYEVKIDCAEWIYWYIYSYERNFFEIPPEEFESMWSEGEKMLLSVKKQDTDPTHGNRVRGALISYYSLKKMWNEAESIAYELPAKSYTKTDALFEIACERKDYLKAEELSKKVLALNTENYLCSAWEQARRISIFGNVRKEEAINAWKAAFETAKNTETFFSGNDDMLIKVMHWQIEILSSLSGDYLALGRVDDSLNCVEKATSIGLQRYAVVKRLTETSEFAKYKGEIIKGIKLIPMQCYNSVIEDDDNILSREERFKECQRRLDELE